VLALARHTEELERARDQAMVEATARLEGLRGDLAQLRGLVDRNASEVGRRLAGASADLTALQGRLDDVWRQLEEAQRLLSRVPTTDARVARLSAPSDADGLWAEGNRQLNADHFDEARRLLRSFVEHHPGDERAAQARFQLGESYFRQDRYSSAIDEYQRVVDQHAQSPLVEDARFKIGLSFLALKACSEARTVLSQLLASNPRTRHERVIRAKLSEIVRGLRNKRLCLS